MVKTLTLTLASVTVSMMILAAAESRSDEFIMRRQIDDDQAVVASRTTAIEHRMSDPVRTASLLTALKDHELFIFSNDVSPFIISEYIVDAVDVELVDDSDGSTSIWSMTHKTPRFVADMPHTCERLVLFDAKYDDGAMWVLYSVQCAVRLDRIAPDDDGVYRVERMIPVLEQRHSGLRPYLMETGNILRYDDAIFVGFRMFGAYDNYERSHPYQFWAVDGHSAIEIEDAEKIKELRSKVSHKLDDKDRPRMTEQLKPPQTAEDEKPE